MQTFARKYNVPIDTLGFKFNVLPQYYDQTSDVKPDLPAVSDGVLVHGLFMDGTVYLYYIHVMSNVHKSHTCIRTHTHTHT